MGDLAITHPPPSPTGKLDIILASYLRGLSSSPVSCSPVKRGCKGGGEYRGKDSVLGANA